MDELGVCIGGAFVKFKPLHVIQHMETFKYGS